MAEVTVSIPSLLAPLFKGEKEVKASATTLRELIQMLIERYGQGVGERFLDGSGRLKPVINIYVNGRNIRFTGGLDTPLRDNDAISVLPAVAGGSNPDTSR